MSRPPPSSCGQSTAQIPLLKARERERDRTLQARNNAQQRTPQRSTRKSTRRRRGHGALAPLLPQTLTPNIKLHDEDPKKEKNPNPKL
jgi:hypothetical protein